MSNAPRYAHLKRFWGSDDSQTPILHVDMDSFFAQVELAENPQLRGKEVIVGGNARRGVVTSATYEARARGVRAGMPMVKAHALCPQAVVLPGRHSLYTQYSRRVMEIFARVTPRIEQVSIDEAFLDVSGARRLFGSPGTIGQMLRDTIRAELGLPASVGIAQSKAVAKIASTHAKPDGMLLVPAERTLDFLHTLPVSALWGVGNATAQRLERAGIDTVADLAHCSEERLQKILGVALARHLYNLAWGKDSRPVTPAPAEKSFGMERTFSEDLTQRADVEAFLLSASHDCARRLRSSGAVAWVISIKVRDSSFNTVTRSVRLKAPTDVGAEIFAAARGLFDKEVMPSGGVRLCGVRCESLQLREDGVPVFLDDNEKTLASERVMDSVRSRFGDKALSPATLLGRPEAPPQNSLPH